jgi:hypothetical protein
MAEFNHNGQPEGEWEDKGNLSWSEADWQQFLQRQEQEVARFLRFYDECPTPGMERLDWVARQMGWDSEDWSVSDFPDDEEAGEGWKEEDANAPEFQDTDPYTLHRHPVFVVTTGLFLQIRYIWRCVLEKHNGKADALVSFDFAESLAEAEKHTLLAMQCMDMGDFLLCVVHLKRALRGINLSLSHLPVLVSISPAPERLHATLRSRLFDLREVCLRVLMDCREEEGRDFRDNEG